MASVQRLRVQAQITGSLQAWRKRYRAGSAEPGALQLLPVTVTADRPIETASARRNELIEIELGDGYRVRVGNGMKAAALRLVLDVLERR